MRTIYLMRHAQPQFEQGRRCCLGQKTDPPLSDEGRRQALALSKCFSSHMVSGVYTSRLRRSSETGQILAAGRWDVTTLPGIEELDCGEWEGKTFAEIQRDYPILYEKRSYDMSIPPPGGERLECAAKRALTAINYLLEHSDGDIAIVAHAGINRAVLCTLMDLPMKDNRALEQPYGCVNVLVLHQGHLEVKAIGCRAEAIPDEQERRRILFRAGTPWHIQRHCIAVKETAYSLYQDLRRAGLELNWSLVCAAAELHDMCRTGRFHAREAARLMRCEGYLRLAAIIEKHEGNFESQQFDEEKLLYLADKLTLETERTTLHHRFAESYRKCTSEEGIRAHETRRKEAYTVLEEFAQILSRSGIPDYSFRNNPILLQGGEGQ